MRIKVNKIACDLIISAVALVAFSAGAAPINVDVNVITPGVDPQPQTVYVVPSPTYIEERRVDIQERPVYREHEGWYWDCKKDKCKQKKLKKEKHHKHDDDY